MSRLTFYRYAVPEWIRLQRARLGYLGVCALRVFRGLTVGRWPWEVVREIREERRMVREAMEPTWKAIEAAVLGAAHNEKE